MIKWRLSAHDTSIYQCSPQQIACFYKQGFDLGLLSADTDWESTPSPNVLVQIFLSVSFLLSGCMVACQYLPYISADYLPQCMSLACLEKCKNWTVYKVPPYKTAHCSMFQRTHCAKKATIHQVTTMLATSKNVLYPGHNHLLTTGADN